MADTEEHQSVEWTDSVVLLDCSLFGSVGSAGALQARPLSCMLLLLCSR